MTLPRGRTVEALLVALSLLVSFALVEIGYRVWLSGELARSAPRADPGRSTTFSADNASFLREDAKFGFRFNEGKHEYFTAYIANGAFDKCDTFKFRADRTDASGPLPNDPAKSALNIVVFGDSFTAIQWEDQTWSSLMQDALERRLGVKVSVLNLARQGMGLLQMIDHAALVVPAVKPDAYVVAYITNDLIRPRFWLLERRIRGRSRLIFSSEPIAEGRELDFSRVTDYLQINPLITKSWCEAMTSAKDAGVVSKDDPVLADLLAQRRDLLSDYDQPLFRVSFWTLRNSFVLNRIFGGNAYGNTALADTRSSYRRVEIQSFEDDPVFVKAVHKLKQAGIPGFLVHLPHHFEIISGDEFDYVRAGGTTKEQGAGLRQSLEKLLGVSSIPLNRHLGSWREDPSSHIWKPNDHHPNRKGIEAISKAVTEALLEHNLGKFVRR